MSEQPQQPARLGQRIHVRLLAVLERLGLKDEYFLVLVSILIGVTTGVFADLFFRLIEFAREFAFGANDHGGLFAGRPWMLIVLPTVGALGLLQYAKRDEASFRKLYDSKRSLSRASKADDWFDHEDGMNFEFRNRAARPGR